MDESYMTERLFVRAMLSEIDEKAAVPADSRITIAKELTSECIELILKRIQARFPMRASRSARTLMHKMLGPIIMKIIKLIKTEE